MKDWKLLPVLMLMAIFGCSEDDEMKKKAPEDEGGGTTVKVVFKDTGRNDNIIFLHTDLDGEGGEAPDIVSGNLRPNTAYDVQVHFLNEVAVPTDSLNYKIREKSDSYQVFMEFDPDLEIAKSYTDADIHGKPVGLSMQVVTDTIGGADMIITLRKFPNKEALGVAHGDIRNAGGETEKEAVFRVGIE